MTDNFKIVRISDEKKRYLPLLLIGDESETMIDRYIDRCDLYAGLIGEQPVAVCASVNETDKTTEIKNLAVHPDFRRKGLGRRMLEHVESVNRGKTIILGTGETPSTLRFYKSCGYNYSHCIANFFTDNYPCPIIEEGVTLRDMIYLKKQ